jgi:hypothetical protein
MTVPKGGPAVDTSELAFGEPSHTQFSINHELLHRRGSEHPAAESSGTWPLVPIDDPTWVQRNEQGRRGGSEPVDCEFSDDCNLELGGPFHQRERDGKQQRINWKSSHNSRAPGRR